MIAMRVVELGIANAHLHVGHAHMVAGAVGQSAELRANGDGRCIRYRVAEKVRRQLLVGVFLIRPWLAERSEGALQLAGHGVEQDRGRCGGFIDRRSECEPWIAVAFFCADALRPASVKPSRVATQQTGFGRTCHLWPLEETECRLLQLTCQRKTSVNLIVSNSCVLEGKSDGNPPARGARRYCGRIAPGRFWCGRRAAWPNSAGSRLAPQPIKLQPHSEQAYSLPPDKLAQAIALNKIRVSLDIAGSLWGLIVLWWSTGFRYGCAVRRMVARKR